MKYIDFPPFTKNGSVRTLNDFIKRIPDNNWIWSILEFEGVGTAPDGISSIPDFEEIALAEPRGFFMKWQEVKKFTSTVQDTINCLLVAAQSINDISTDKTSKYNYNNCEIVIEVFDSTEWSIGAKDQDIVNRFFTLLEK